MNGKVALITGGGTGIGAACARRLARDGAKVVVVGRRKAVLDDVVKSIGVLALVADASNTGEMQGVVTEVLRKYGRIDILIASAGGHGLGSATDTDDDAWQKSISSNLNSAFVASRECLPTLCKHNGSILLISSIAGLVAGPEVCGYTTTKHALIGLTRSLARDYGPKGVRVNAICPGWVRTPMADEEMQVLMDKYGINLDQAYQMVTSNVPLRRPATADEIASACRFLVSDDAAIITGAVLVADGGSMVVDLPTLAFSSILHTQE